VEGSAGLGSAAMVVRVNAGGMRVRCGGGVRRETGRGENSVRGQVRVWDVRVGRCSGCFGPGSEALDVLSVALHPSAPLIASGLAGPYPSRTPPPGSHPAVIRPMPETGSTA
jgi:hypothetical protein